MSKRIWLLFTLALFAFAPLAGCEVEGGDDPDTVDGKDTVNPSSATVTYTANGASPTTVNINRGGTVTFKNDDVDPHHIDITGVDDFELQPGASATRTFSQSGSFNFSCLFHAVGNENEAGVINVQ